LNRLAMRFVTGVATAAFGIVALAVHAASPALAQPAPNFGAPPSGEVPLLYNDQHVYSKPDRLKQGRLLAALVRGNTILVPLRSMFEQMGATVSYNNATKTVDVSKPGADVQVTVGKPEVTINGESRPLDVPPEIYKGSVVVPVRVISEGMGAYVLWVPEKRLVVVRYIPATPPPAPPATPAPTPPPTPAPIITPPPPPPPTPSPKPKAQFEGFVAGDALFSPKTYNEFSAGQRGDTSLGARAGLTFGIQNLAFLAELQYQQYVFAHVAGGAGCPGDPGCVTTIGNQGQTFVPAFTAINTTDDGRIGIGFFKQFYVVGSYENNYTNYGYPHLTGVGFGLEKLPDFDHFIDYYGSFLYYPQISGNFTDPSGNGFQLQYVYYKYQGGITISIPKTPIFLEGGIVGDHGIPKQNAPAVTTDHGIYAGVGIHF
jgi:hypothetical protein